MTDSPPNLWQGLAKSFLYCLLFVLVLWVIEWLEWQNDWRLAQWGLYPRRYWGLLGIITAPFLHGDWLHLISNTFPLLLLGTFVLYAFPKSLKKGLIFWLWFLSGFWTWLFAREAYHIGASGLVYGLAGFLFFRGVFSTDRASMAVSFIIILLYSGMLGGLLPNDQHISWESHLSGLLVGAGFAYAFRHLDQQNIGIAQSHQNMEELAEIEGVYKIDDVTGEAKPIRW